MLWLLIAPLWIALLIGLIWFFLRAKNNAGRYEAIFEPAHLIEFAEVVRRVRADALETAHGAAPSSPSPGGSPTTGGLRLHYTAAREAAAWQHHFSMACEGGALAPSTARFLFAYSRHLLGLEGVPVELGVSDANRFHMTWAIPESAEYAWEAREVPVPAPEELQGVLEQCWHQAEQVRISGTGAAA